IAFRYDDGRRYDLDVETVDFARSQRLLLVMGMIRAKWQCELSIKLAMRCAQPSLPHRRMGIECALKHDLLHVRREYPQHHKNVCISSRRGDLQLDGHGSRDLDRRSHRFGDEGDAGAGRLKAYLAFNFGSFGSQFMPVGREMKLGPLRSRYRPLVLMPYDELFSGMADIELNPRLLVPAILL